MRLNRPPHSPVSLLVAPIDTENDQPVVFGLGVLGAVKNRVVVRLPADGGLGFARNLGKVENCRVPGFDPDIRSRRTGES